MKDLPKEVEKASSSSPKDRRYFPRWDVSSKVLLRKENELLYKECHSKDINCTGVCVRTYEDVIPSKSLYLTIFLAEDIEPLQVKGHVRWIVRNKDSNTVGIQFDELTEKASDLIFQYAFEYKKDEVINRWYGSS